MPDEVVERYDTEVLPCGCVIGVLRRIVTDCGDPDCGSEARLGL